MSKQVPPFRLDEQLCFALYAASRTMTQAYQPMLTKLKLTYVQYLVLLVLWETDDLSVKELGQRLLLDSGTLTPVLKRMESQKYITRIRSAKDERQVRIELTAKGQAMEEKARLAVGETFCRLHKDVSDWASLRDRLHKLIGQLGMLTQANSAVGR